MPIDQNSGKRRQATETERITVIEKDAEGKNYRQIARETAVSKSEAQRIVKRWETTKIIVTGLFLSNENTIGPAVDLLALVLREASRDRR